MFALGLVVLSAGIISIYGSVKGVKAVDIITATLTGNTTNQVGRSVGTAKAPR